MPMIASPTAPTITWPPGQSMSLAVVESVPFFFERRRSGGGVHGADADHDVDDRLARRGDPLADLREALLVAVAEDRLEPLPDGEQEHPDRDGPHQGLAERLLRELLDGALRVRRALLVAQGQLDGQPGDEQVDDAVGDQADPGGVVDPLALVACWPACSAAVLMLLMRLLPLPPMPIPGGAGSLRRRGRPGRSRWPGGTSGRRRSSTRSVATGTAACTATARKPMISPPAGPTTVAPTSTPRSASSTTLTRPRAPGPWVKPREDSSSFVLPVRTVSPASRACASVIPTPADLGIGEGGVRERVVRRRRAVLAEDVAAGDRRTGTSTRA